ncbi:MAG TPA: hypothetical protein VKW70_02920 [Terriglobia bacterium]|nr:hypothetical protein [Terriglobia bacterium]
MKEPERWMLTREDEDRLKVLQEVERGHLTQWVARQQLGLRERRMRKLRRLCIT